MVFPGSHNSSACVSVNGNRIIIPTLPGPPNHYNIVSTDDVSVSNLTDADDEFMRLPHRGASVTAHPPEPPLNPQLQGSVNQYPTMYIPVDPMPTQPMDETPELARRPRQPERKPQPTPYDHAPGAMRPVLSHQLAPKTPQLSRRSRGPKRKPRRTPYEHAPSARRPVPPPTTPQLLAPETPQLLAPATPQVAQPKDLRARHPFPNLLLKIKSGSRQGHGLGKELLMRRPFPNLFPFMRQGHGLGKELLMRRPFSKLFLRPKPKPKLFIKPNLFLKPKLLLKPKPKPFLKPKRALGEAFPKVMKRRRPCPNLKNQGDASRAAF